MSQVDRSILQQRREAFPGFISECQPVLNNFLELVKLPQTNSREFNYKECVKLVGNWLGPQKIPKDGENWIVTVLVYLFGEYFVHVHGGQWMLNEIEGSKFFGRYVIGKFPATYRLASMVDPFAMASDYVGAPPGRDIKLLLEMAEGTLLVNNN